MALVHEQLYQSDDLSRVEFAGYVQSLLDYLWRAHGTAAAHVRLVLDLQPLYLSVNAAVPCGLILNELVSNALKHAFRGRTSGQVNVSLAGGEDGDVQLRIRDNGRGLPPGADWRQSRSLGLRLVQMLAGQLGGNVEVETGEDEGADFRIVFGHVGERNRGDREQGEPADR
jgi:two-component sensor histidine kinase